jgi:hypothetical protein
MRVSKISLKSGEKTAYPPDRLTNTLENPTLFDIDADNNEYIEKLGLS